MFKWVLSYKAVYAIDMNACNLALPKVINTHLLFNISLLKPYQGKSLTPAAVDIEGEKKYKVDSLVSHGDIKFGR